ncbi:MAG: ABC transporter substrate-binding protein [Oscillospiraceae bacterium]|nr:ABC transporter substrate-binding protein [Oscillospiraceae bacterium]
MKKFFALAMTLMFYMAMLTGCGGGSKQSEKTTIRIGGIGPLTGGAATYGIATRNGAQIAVDEINALGGLQLELNFQDDESDQEKAVNAYNVLKDWDMQILYGCTTTGPCVTIAGETYGDRYFQLTPSASSPDVTAGHDNVFQMCFTDPNQGKTAANYVKDNGLATKIAVLYNNGDSYSAGIAVAFAAEAKAIGLEVVAEVTFPDDNTADFSAQIAECQNAGAEMVFMPIYYTPASLVLSQAKGAGYEPIFFGGDGMDGILSMEGFDTSLAEGLLLMTPFNATATDERTTYFVNTYTELYGTETLNQFAADGYDCIWAIYEACVAAGITPETSHEDVCEALIAQFTGGLCIDGLTGTGMTWQTNGEVSKDAMVVKVVNGAYVQQ